MKKIALIITVVVVFLAIIIFATDADFLKKTPLKNLDLAQFGLISQDALNQSQQLKSQALETSQHVQNVLGEHVEASENSTEQKNKPIHEKTLEYARYLYCKQVVEDWEHH